MMQKIDSYEGTIENLLWTAIENRDETRESIAQKEIDNIYHDSQEKILAYVGKENRLVVSDYLSDLNLQCEGKAYCLGFRKAMDIMTDYIVEKSVQPIHQ